MLLAVDDAGAGSSGLQQIVQLAPEGTDKEAMLLDKKGNVVMSVEQHNDSVRVDVAKTIGPKLAGLEEGATAAGGSK